MSQGAVKIALCDDHDLFRKGLKALIAKTERYRVVYEYDSAEAFHKDMFRPDFDCLLLDISLTGRSGLDLLKQIRSSKLTYPVIILSMQAEENYALRALKQGADGYLSKDASFDEMVQALDTVMNGRKYLPPKVDEMLLNEIRGDGHRAKHHHLSDREFSVMVALAEGKTVSQIAEAYSLSVKTISTHKTRMMQKMGFSNLAEIIHYVQQHELGAF